MALKVWSISLRSVVVHCANTHDTTALQQTKRFGWLQPIVMTAPDEDIAFCQSLRDSVRRVLVVCKTKPWVRVCSLPRGPRFPGLSPRRYSAGRRRAAASTTPHTRTSLQMPRPGLPDDQCHPGQVSPQPPRSSRLQHRCRPFPRGSACRSSKRHGISSGAGRTLYGSSCIRTSGLPHKIP